MLYKVIHLPATTVGSSCRTVPCSRDKKEVKILVCFNQSINDLCSACWIDIPIKFTHDQQ